MTTTTTRLELENLTGTTMKIGGAYHKPGATNHPIEKPLHYVVTANSQDSLSTALQAIEYATKNGFIPRLQVCLYTSSSTF